jgi:protein JSN1
MSRLRATTVSNPYRLPSGLPEDDDDDEYYMNEYNDIPTNNNLRTPIDNYGGGDFRGEDPIALRYRESQLAPPALSTNGRARAISMGNLDEQMRKMPGRHAYDLEASAYESELSAASLLYGQAPPSSILKDGRARAGSMATPPSVRFPPADTPRGLAYGVAGVRSVSPKLEAPAQTQAPSRSLWIGNLDPTFTSEDLIRVFAPYGAIESLRLLPEKARSHMIPKAHH